MMPSLSYDSIILDRRWFNDEIFELRCSKPESFSFLPGQFIPVRYLDTEREYTIISAPEEPVLRLLIKRAQQGRLSVLLAELAMGTKVSIGQAQGYFCFEPSDREACFIATGTGIAPFISMAASGVRGFTLLHVVRHPSALVYREELSRAAKLYVPCLSSDAALTETTTEIIQAHPAAFHGYVSSYVETTLAPGNYDFYLCGLRTMIHYLTHLLDARYPQARIYSEAYD